MKYVQIYKWIFMQFANVSSLVSLDYEHILHLTCTVVKMFFLFFAHFHGKMSVTCMYN